MMKLYVSFVATLCSIAISATALAEQENPDPPDEGEVECPEGQHIEEGSNFCTDDENGDCPEGFDHYDIGGGLCHCDGETDDSGACISDDPGEGGGGEDDGCPPGYYKPDGSWFCVPIPGEDGPTNGCPEGYQPVGEDNICFGDHDPSTPTHQICPRGWYQIEGTGVCFPHCVVMDRPCEWGWQPGPAGWLDGCAGKRCRVVATLTSITALDAHGQVLAVHPVDSPAGSTCGPDEVLRQGTCTPGCEVFTDLPCPSDATPWLWVGWPRWEPLGLPADPYD